MPPSSRTMLISFLGFKMSIPYTRMVCFMLWRLRNAILVEKKNAKNDFEKSLHFEGGGQGQFGKSLHFEFFFFMTASLIDFNFDFKSCAIFSFIKNNTR